MFCGGPLLAFVVSDNYSQKRCGMLCSLSLSLSIYIYIYVYIYIVICTGHGYMHMHIIIVGINWRLGVCWPILVIRLFVARWFCYMLYHDIYIYTYIYIYIYMVWSGLVWFDINPNNTITHGHKITMDHEAECRDKTKSKRQRATRK